MTDNKELDPRDFTFSQAQGYEELPGPLGLGEISHEARVRLWDLVVGSAWDHRPSLTDWGWQPNTQWPQIFEVLHRDFLQQPKDEFLELQDGIMDGCTQLLQLYKKLILHDLPFNKVFDLFQMIMRHQGCPRCFTLEVARTIEECRLAYVVDTEGTATVIPAATSQEGEAVIEALRKLRDAGLSGAETHLCKASELINSGDWPGSTRESIHAVESVARQLDPDAAKTLGPALASLERRGRLHPALKEAFGQLYGYTSDEEGVRHALLTNPKSQVGQDEAVFMLGACASFASYLWRRHQAGSQV